MKHSIRGIIHTFMFYSRLTRPDRFSKTSQVSITKNPPVIFINLSTGASKKKLFIGIFHSMSENKNILFNKFHSISGQKKHFVSIFKPISRHKQLFFFIFHSISMKKQLFFIHPFTMERNKHVCF